MSWYLFWFLASKLCQNFIFIFNQASYINFSCAELCLLLRAVNANRRVVVCKRLYRLLAIKTKSYKERKKLQDRSREKNLQLINFSFRLEFLVYWRRRALQRIVRIRSADQTSKKTSKCHKKRYMLFSCGLLLCFVSFYLFIGF